MKKPNNRPVSLHTPGNSFYLDFNKTAAQRPLCLSGMRTLVSLKLKHRSHCYVARDWWGFTYFRRHRDEIGGLALYAPGYLPLILYYAPVRSRFAFLKHSFSIGSPFQKNMCVISCQYFLLFLDLIFLIRIYLIFRNRPIIYNLQVPT